MNPRLRLTWIAVLAAVIGVSSALAAGGGKPIPIRSSLDGKKVLPLRTRWLAYPKVPASRVADVDGNVIHVYAPIQMAPFSDGRGGVSRFGHHGIGGTDCREDGPFGSYTWSVSGEKLTLTATKEGCGQRRAIWEGTWSRVG